MDDATIARVNELGGIAEIAISHPHYYTSMVEWSRAFGGSADSLARGGAAMGDEARSAYPILDRRRRTSCAVGSSW